MALLVCLVRLIKGPTTADRVVSFDASSAVVMSIVGVMSVIFNSVSYLDSIMLIAIISFVSSVSISRFIGEGRVFNGNHKRHFIVNSGFFSVRLLLSLVFINLTSPVGMHLISRAAYRNGAYMYRKDDAPRQSTILLSQKEFNTPEELKKRAKLREERREKLYYKEKEYINKM
ncbi:MAG: monovalent cation/H+ antiporter complex subunit F [Staphylococcus epidermidis]|nr:monovalent cation/H+ antiporter complex subunit F [Staphylococcus epidermidis]